MKLKLITLLFVFYNGNIVAQDTFKEYYPLKGKTNVSVNIGASEVLGGNEKSEIIPLSNIGVGYHLTNRFSLLAESIFHHQSIGNSENEVIPEYDLFNVISYGFAARYLGRKYNFCPTPFIQSGIYIQHLNNRAVTNWLISPGFLLSLHEKDKLFMKIIGDFQAIQLFEGKPFLMSAKVGISYYF
jgi:hypothetical protein